MPILIFALGLTGLWDGFTTFYGTSKVLGNEPVQILASVAFAVIILGFLFSTKIIWEYSQNEFLSLVLRFMWVISISFDAFTSFVGNRDIILGSSNSMSQVAILIAMTILVSGSPILFSYFIEDY